MSIFAGLGYLGFLFSIISLFGIGYHKTRIRELTIGLGILIEEVNKLKKEIK